MSGVKRKDGETFEEMLKRFKKVITKDGILQEYKKRQFYEKPSERRKKEMAAARRRLLRRLRKEQQKYA
ncbi:30S ribosomal protein S21 [Candidatus Woesearchaeota archaeon]|nr:MAG: 30S ribosomal protein S21 [Candidatus Woesearchaeota archaeon]